MSLWKPALAGTLLGPLVLAACGGAWCLLRYREGEVTPWRALAVALLCAAFSIGVHLIFFRGPLYGPQFEP